MLELIMIDDVVSVMSHFIFFFILAKMYYILVVRT